MLEKQKHPRFRLSSSNRKFSFIAPLHLERCLNRILNLKEFGWIYPKVRVSIKQVDRELYDFRVTKIRNKGRDIAIYGKISPQSEQTTLVLGMLDERRWFRILRYIPLVVLTLVILPGFVIGDVHICFLLYLLLMWSLFTWGAISEQKEFRRFRQSFYDALTSPESFEELGIQMSDGDIY